MRKIQLKDAKANRAGVLGFADWQRLIRAIGGS
jgi:hypothetical protein